MNLDVKSFAAGLIAAVLSFLAICTVALRAQAIPSGSGRQLFNVVDYGAKRDGRRLLPMPSVELSRQQGLLVGELSMFLRAGTTPAPSSCSAT
jgi:hypothetical protein